jgi:hypothetical protein
LKLFNPNANGVGAGLDIHQNAVHQYAVAHADGVAVKQANFNNDRTDSRGR